MTIILSKNGVDIMIITDSGSTIEQKEYKDEDIYICGGASIYKQFLPYCDTAYITKVEREFSADSFFPDLDKDDEWEMTEESEEQTYFDNTFYFTTYRRK